MKKKIISIFLMPVCILCGCIIHKHPSKNGSEQSVMLDAIEVTAKKGGYIYRAKATKAWEILNTRIALSFNITEKTASAREWVQLHPYCYATDSITLDAKSMRIDSVQIVAKSGNSNLKYIYENDALKIYLNKVYLATDTIQLYFKYTAMPYTAATGGSKAITDDRGLYFINTDNKIPNKPAEIWTQGESESNSHWMITIDKPNTRFTTQVELTIPDTMASLSNGTLVEQLNNGNGTRTDIWRMDMPIQAYVVMFAIGKFSIIKDSWHGKEVNYYVELGFAPYAGLIFRYTPEMMDCFSSRTGVPFPWNKYDQVVVRDYVSGAMENTTAALFGEFMNRTARELADNNGEDVVAHELFHEWFGDYVTCASWSNLTLNESFANYGEQLWRIWKYGKASADELAYNDLERYLRSSRFHDPQLVRYYYNTQEEMFDGITYNKGGAILHYLNVIAGDRAFDKAMKLYLTQNALHSAEARDWQHAVEETTGQDWNWFFNEWYYHPGHPVLTINYNYDDSARRLAVVVKQEQSDSPFLYILPLKAAIITPGTKTIVNWNINKRTDTFWYSYQAGEKPVVIPDYEHVLPGDLNDKKQPGQWLAQYRYADDYTSRRLALNAASSNLSDSVMQIIADLALDDKIISLRRTAIDEIKGTQSTYYRSRWGQKVAAMAKNDSSNLVRAVAFGLLGAWKDTASIQLMIRACDDSSYAVAGAALDGLGRIDTQAAYSIAIGLLSSGPKAALESATWDIIGNRAVAGDIVLYEKNVDHVIGNNSKYTFLKSLDTYLKNVKDDSSFAKGVRLFAINISFVGAKNMRSKYGMQLLSLAGDINEKLRSGNKDEIETAKRRVDILKPSLQQMIIMENEPMLKESYEKKMKEIYGE